MDPSVAVGLGHLMRLACLRRLLKTPAVVLGPVDARIDDGGLRLTRRRAPLGPDEATRVVIVDRNVIPPSIIAWRLADRARRVVWIKRGNADDRQAIRQSGYVPFADLIVVPGDIGGARDAADAVAARHGKLREVGVCHVYQVVAAGEPSPAGRVFLSLGAFEPGRRAAYVAIGAALDRARIPFIWSGYDDAPLAFGFTRKGRVAVHSAISAKPACSGLVCEGGYNSVHEALHLGQPALLLANEDNGRERQSRRLGAAKRVSPLVYDAALLGDRDAWLAAVQSAIANPSRRAVNHDVHQRGFAEMADLVEAFLAEAAA
jgi:hypothetical protein